MKTELIYLGKEGQAHGPYTLEEIQEIKTSGKYIEFSWLWSPVEGTWLPINMPPPPPGAKVRVATATKRERSVRGQHLHVLCHDNQRIIAGLLGSVSEESFTLEAETDSALPIFQKGYKVWVNLLDEKSGRGENLRAVILGVGRHGGVWEYQMKWDRSPELLKDV